MRRVMRGFQSQGSRGDPIWGASGAGSGAGSTLLILLTLLFKLGPPTCR